MTGEEIKAGFEFLAREMTEGFARLNERLETRFGAIEMRLGAIESTLDRWTERLAHIERRLELLEEAVARLDRRTAIVESSLADIKDRLSRLSRDVLLGRTEEAERYGVIQRRLSALEATMSSS